MEDADSNSDLEPVVNPCFRPPLKEGAFDVYRLYVEMNDALAGRRQNANTFFFTLSAGLCTAIAFLYSKDTDESLRPHAWLIALAGIPIGIFWQSLIGSYKNLGTAKFDVIHQMEKHLMFMPYAAEWKILGEGKTRKLYIPLTHSEIWVPRSFGIAFIALTVWLSPWVQNLGSRPSDPLLRDEAEEKESSESPKPQDASPPAGS